MAVKVKIVVMRQNYHSGLNYLDQVAGNVLQGVKIVWVYAN